MKNRHRKFAEVDITPLIDMMFMLIIFFVLTSSFVNGKITVELPTGKSITPNAQKAVTVMVLADGSIQWDGKKVSKVELATFASKYRGMNVHVAGDKRVNYGAVAEVLAILKHAGVTSAGLLMESEGK